MMLCIVYNPSNLVSVRADGHAEGPRQAEVCQFDLPLGVDEQVLGLQVSMQNPVRVTEGQALQQLEQVALQRETVKHSYTQATDEQLIQILSTSQYGQVQYPNRRSCNFGGEINVH